MQASLPVSSLLLRPGILSYAVSAAFSSYGMILIWLSFISDADWTGCLTLVESTSGNNEGAGEAATGFRGNDDSRHRMC
ncbi:hypothetical protein Tco_0630435 [Tanacetum coccineum]